MIKRRSSHLIGWSAVLILFGFGLVSCGASSNSSVANAPRQSQQSGKKTVLTTFTILADMARNVAGDRLIVESITKPGAEIHHYEPTPSDIARAQKADLVLYNGLGLEAWFEKFMGAVRNVPSTNLSDGIQPISISEGSYANKPNPHAWMSPTAAAAYVENIRKAFVALDPANAAAYNANAKAYIAQLQQVSQEVKNQLAKLPENQRHLVSCEGAFSYMARDYGLKESYLWAINSDEEGTPKQIAKVVETVKQNQVPAVFCETTVSDKAQRQVAKEAGSTYGGALYVDSLSDANGPAATFLALQKHNANTLTQGLIARSRS